MIRKKRDFRAGINFSRDRNPVPWKNVLPVGKKTAPPSLISMLLQFLTGNFSNCFIEQLCAIYAQMDMDIFAVQRIILERRGGGGVYFSNNAISRSAPSNTLPSLP